MAITQDALYALRARRAGARYQWRIIRAAKKEGVRLSLAFALVEQETAFRNIYGHDPTIFVGAGVVTERNYRLYKRLRGDHGQGGMQGVGPCQLTWWATQDQADKEGGCWDPGVNIRIGLRTLALNIRNYGGHTGIARYNGSGPDAERYANEVERKQQRWHKILTTGKP